MMAEQLPSRKVEKLLAVKGMNDILPPESAQWEALETKVRALMRRFAFENIRTPILEPTALFVRGLGEVTDIVEKEMYSFDDRLNGEALTLRPENTAGVVRAAVEHNLLYGGGKRLYYMGPMFRHERPQRGRYRQFHQIGAEALGFAGAEVDAELILMAHALWQELGLTGVALHLNPLRLLDSKNPEMQAVIESAPRLIDFLGEASRAHLAAVQAILDANGVPYSINPRLVRGMDYYNLTVFEFVTTQLGSQGTICAGGRYDYLTEQIGGKPAPAVGWAMGVERVLELLKESALPLSLPSLDAYAIVTDAAALPAVMTCLQQLRAAGVAVQMHACAADGAMASMKAQFKRADASGSRFALVFGPDELQAGVVTIKALRNSAIAQTTQALNSPEQWANSLQSNA